MNAQVVWQVWRRIMREPALQHALFVATPEGAPKDGAALARFGFDPEQRAAALAYGAEGERAKWFVVNYRYRLANSFLNALENGAPMVLRALLAKGLDLRQLGEQFLDQHGWKDYGPNVYTYCRDALRFLAEREESAAPHGLRQLIGLERTAVELLLGLAEPPPPLQPAAPGSSGPLTRTPWARYYRSDAQLVPWLRDKKQLGKSALEPGTEHYLVYLPDLEQPIKYALLPARAAEIYQAVAQPCAPQQLGDALAALGHPAHTGHDQQCLAALAGYRAIAIGARE